MSTMISQISDVNTDLKYIGRRQNNLMISYFDSLMNLIWLDNDFDLNIHNEI